MTSGQSPRMTAAVAERAMTLSLEFDRYIRESRIVEIEALRIGRQLQELAQLSDVADATLGLMLCGLREDGIESERWNRLLRELQRFHEERQGEEPTPPGAPAVAQRRAA